MIGMNLRVVVLRFEVFVYDNLCSRFDDEPRTLSEDFGGRSSMLNVPLQFPLSLPRFPMLHATRQPSISNGSG